MRRIPNTIVTTRTNVGTQLRVIRLARKWTQARMAERLGVSVWWLSRVECGVVDLSNQPSFVNTLFSRV